MNWKVEIKEFLKEPSEKNNRKIKLRSLNYTLIEGELLKKRPDGVLLKCVSLQEAKVIMTETHEGICGAHQAGQMMRWLIIRNGYFWPKMGEMCVQYAKGRLACQKKCANSESTS